MQFIKNHPVLVAGLGFIAAAVPVIQAGWSLFSNEPLFVVVGRDIGELPQFSMYWVSLPIAGAGLVMLGVVIYQQTSTSRFYRARAAVAGILGLRELAVHTLLHRAVNTQADLDQLKRDIDLWQGTLLDQLVLVASQSDVSYFRVLGTFNKSLPGWNAEHAHERSMLAERIDRITEIARRIEDRSMSR